MVSTAFEILLILVLLTVAGALSTVDKAVSFSRKTRLRELLDAGNRGAGVTLDLISAPRHRLLAIRIGTTALGAAAGIIGGARVAAYLAATFQSIPGLAFLADFAGFTLAIFLISLLWLVICEQIPTELASRHPESIATRTSGIVLAIVRPLYPLAKILTSIESGLLRTMGFHSHPSTPKSKEEISQSIRDTLDSGGSEEEFRMIRSVIDFENLIVHDIMIPRPKMNWIDVASQHEQAWPKIVGSSQTHFPIYENNRDNLIGVISVKDCYAQLAAGIEVSFKHLLQPPLLVPVTQKASATLELFRETGTHIAFALDEFGAVIGMVTLIDLMESIVGDVPSKEELRMLTIRKRGDNSWLIDGVFETDRLAEYLDGFEIQKPDGEEFHTVSGLFNRRLGRVPEVADCIEESGWKLEIVRVDGMRVDQVIASPIAAQTVSEPAPSSVVGLKPEKSRIA